MVPEVPVDDDTGLVWKALADPTRRAILDLLRDRAHTTGELSGAFPALTRFAVMKHLGVLEDAGLVVVRRRGRERWNHLNGVPLRAAYERWMGQYADRWAESLLRLKETAERQEGAGMTATLDVEQEVVVAAPREKVFDALCRMGEWWPHAFREGSSGAPGAAGRRPLLGGLGRRRRRPVRHRDRHPPARAADLQRPHGHAHPGDRRVQHGAGGAARRHRWCGCPTTPSAPSTTRPAPPTRAAGARSSTPCGGHLGLAG